MNRFEQVSSDGHWMPVVGDFGLGIRGLMGKGDGGRRWVGPRSNVLGSQGQALYSEVNASWGMVTWGTPSSMDSQNDRHTRLKTLLSTTLLVGGKKGH